MDRARVVHFEDDPSVRQSTQLGLEALSDNRHQVVAVGGDLEQALDIVHQIASGEVKADVILLDGDLGTGYTDALIISQRIEELRIPIFTIGVSGRAMADLGVEVDVDLTKTNMSPLTLIAVLDNLDK